MATKRKKPAITIRRVQRLHREYYYGLGMFLDRFAQTELFLALRVFMLCGLSWDDGRALFSGMRMEEAMNNIKRLAELRKLSNEAKASLTDAFSHLRAITELRNSLLHYGASFDPSVDERITTNALRSLNEKSFTVSAADFLSLYHDLDKAEAHVDVALTALIPSQTFGDPFAERLQRAWLYKFPQLKSLDKPRPKQQAQKRQPRSSPS